MITTASSTTFDNCPTVFRKLRDIEYMTSYSHSGRFYALKQMADFDLRGLWSYRDVHFSQFGSLIDTVEHFVLQSDAGVFASELSTVLKVEVKDPLLKLFRSGRIAREELDRLYLYCSSDRSRKRLQLLARRTTVPAEPFGAVPRQGTTDETKAAIILFLGSLNERQRRLFAGLESLRLGPGSDQRIAEWTGLDVHTVAKGRHELHQRDLKLDRIRRPGAGRPSVEKKRPK
jgi:hypothetical protein